MQVEAEGGEAQPEDRGDRRDGDEGARDAEARQDDEDHRAGDGGGGVDLAAQDQGHLRAEHVTHDPPATPVTVPIRTTMGAGTPAS